MGSFEDSRKLENLLGITPNTLIATHAMFDQVRTRIEAMTKDIVPPACSQAFSDYKTMRSRAFNLVRGGGSPSNMNTIWANFVAAAVKLVECLNNQPKG